MRDGVDFMLRDEPGDKVGVPRVADDKLRAIGDSPGEAGRQIVENDDRLSRVHETQRHMTADVSRAAGHQNAHPLVLSLNHAPRGPSKLLGSRARSSATSRSRCAARHGDRSGPRGRSSGAADRADAERGAGFPIDRKRVRRLMRVMGIEALGPKPRTTKRAPGHKICPYLLRDLTIDRPSGGVTTTPGGRTDHRATNRRRPRSSSPPSRPGRLRNPRPAPPPDSVGGSAIVLIQVNNSPVTLCRTRSASASGLLK